MRKLTRQDLEEKIKQLSPYELATWFLFEKVKPDGVFDCKAHGWKVYCYKTDRCDSGITIVKCDHCPPGVWYTEDWLSKAEKINDVYIQPIVNQVRQLLREGVKNV